jgi:hypothetical protein
MKNNKSIFEKFESDKINQMQKITGGDEYVVGFNYYMYYSKATATEKADGGHWDKYLGHGEWGHV